MHKRITEKMHTLQSEAMYVLMSENCWIFLGSCLQNPKNIHFSSKVLACFYFLSMVWWGNSGGAAYAGRGPKAGFYFRDTDCLPVSGRGRLNYDGDLKGAGGGQG